MRRIALGALALVFVSAVSAGAQYTKKSGQRGKSHTYIYFEPTNTTCTAGTMSDEVRKIKIESPFLTAGMISPDSAKATALCYVPGQISSGEMESNGTRTVYVVSVLPTDKKTYSKVIIDANTGQVLSTKQFGGARGLAGFLRESQKRKHNKVS
jgi:uncharacterized membrane protein YkoI